VLQQELAERKRVITENPDFVALAPFASRSPFEMCIFPKFHSSAFCATGAKQFQSLAAILKDVLQRLDRTLGSPPYNLSLQDRPFLRPRDSYWKTIEEDFHWHLEILPQVIGMTGFERASWFFYNPVPPELGVRCLSG
jgi:UDPglucose--hexose-1-phosphate uridylyltransferase